MTGQEMVEGQPSPGCKLKGELTGTFVLTARWKLFGLRGLESPDKICPSVKTLPLMDRKKTPSPQEKASWLTGAITHSRYCQTQRPWHTPTATPAGGWGREQRVLGDKMWSESSHPAFLHLSGLLSEPQGHRSSLSAKPWKTPATSTLSQNAQQLTTSWGKWLQSKSHALYLNSVCCQPPTNSSYILVTEPDLIMEPNSCKYFP